MGNTESQRSEKKKERQFSQEQYDMLLRCSKMNDIKEWNDWHYGMDTEILLEGAELGGLFLEGIDLRKAMMCGANLSGTVLCDANMFAADMIMCNLTKTDMRGSQLKNTDFRQSCFRDADLSNAKLEGTKLNNADLRTVRFTGSRLIDLDLSGMDLTGTDFSKTGIMEVCFDRAILRGVSFKKSGITATFIEANMREVDLSESKIMGNSLKGADLRGANLYKSYVYSTDLSKANLHHAVLVEAKLCECEIREACLDRSYLLSGRIIKCELSRSSFEGAIVGELQLYELKSLPFPPKMLWLDRLGKNVLTGHKANSFFTREATVEVYLNEAMSRRELACFYLHMAEIEDRGFCKGIFFVGHRYEGIASVLRFAGPDYASIYEVLPDLLAPFRMARAIDWAKFFNSFPPYAREDATTALMKISCENVEDRWNFARRMGEVFSSYANAKVVQIVEGGERALRIEVYTNEEIAKKLAQADGPSKSNEKQEIMLRTGEDGGWLLISNIKELKRSIDELKDTLKSQQQKGLKATIHDSALGLIQKMLEDIALCEMKDASKILLEIGKLLGPLVTETKAYNILRQILGI